MKMELYKLTKPAGFNLKARIDYVMSQDLIQRNRVRTGGLIRLEQVEKRGDLWLCDFLKIRTDHGPSKAGENVPAQGFELGPKDGFGEETALLWNTANDWCVLQYNHHGSRSNSVAEYLAHYIHAEPVELHFLPKIDDDIQAKILHKTHVNKISFSIAPREVSDADYAYGAGLGEATKMLKNCDADHIEITLSAHRKNRLGLTLSDFVKWIEHIRHGADNSPIGSAHATAREYEDEAPEVLDLLHNRITAEVEILPGVDKRYSMKERFDAIHRAHDGWSHLMI
jgi:hypothetical protein